MVIPCGSNARWIEDAKHSMPQFYPEGLFIEIAAVRSKELSATFITGDASAAEKKSCEISGGSLDDGV